MQVKLKLENEKKTLSDIDNNRVNEKVELGLGHVVTYMLHKLHILSDFFFQFNFCLLPNRVGSDI